MSSRARDVVSGVTNTQLITPQSVTDATKQSSAVDMTQYDGLVGILVENDADATTVNANLIECATETGTYTLSDDYTFTQVAATATSTYTQVDKRTLKKYIKLNVAVAGTGEVSATLLGQKQNIA